MFDPIKTERELPNLRPEIGLGAGTSPGISSGMPKKKLVEYIVFGVIGIIIIAAIVLLVMTILKPGSVDEDNYIFVEKTSEHSVLVNVCETIQDDVCDSNTIFTSGDSVWLLVSVYNLQSLEGEISYEEEMIVYGPDGEIIPEAGGIVLEETKAVTGDGGYDIKLINEIVTSTDDRDGGYKVEIRVRDKNTRDFEVDSTAFMLI